MPPTDILKANPNLAGEAVYMLGGAGGNPEILMTDEPDAAAELDGDRRANGGRRTITARRRFRCATRTPRRSGIKIGDTLELTLFGEYARREGRQRA